jgi:hypothetical protein
MIKNDYCPYCGILMSDPGNSDDSRTIEHMIPNAVVTKNRNRDDGDFYCCRKCNQKKSKMDDLIGKSAKMQSKDNKLAADTMISEFKKGKKRFLNMLFSVTKKDVVIKSRYPFNGIELVEYIEFLGKGQFFKNNKRIFSNDHVIIYHFYNKEITLALEAIYGSQHNSNPFRDLQKNQFSENINDGESIIYSKGNRFLFFLHDYVILGVDILDKTKKNSKLSNQSIKQIFLDFKK